MLKAVFFDLDGTLLPLDEETFAKGYMKLLTKKMIPYSYDPNMLVKVIYEGVKYMYINDGKKSNEEVFWDTFLKYYPKEKLADKPIFDSFYSNEFKEAKVFTGESKLAKSIVDFVKENGLIPVLSTNPIFPYVGQRTRLSFINLKPEDFAYVTSYENSRYCKPNPLYFKDLLEKFSLKPEEVILFGNNDYEDGDCASSLGIKVYLIKRCIIHSPHAKGKYDEIDMEDVENMILKEIKERNC